MADWDLRERSTYALHNGVPDANGTGGEFSIRGIAVLVDDPQVRTIAAAATTYEPADRYILFGLTIDEARCGGYGDVELPQPSRWAAV